jgi:UDPglucose--hexose-1-phosphate uridylyltransferase
VSIKNPKAYGYHEVVIETREHNERVKDLSVDHWIAIMEAFIARTKEITRDKKIKYILIFKNEGGSAGASLTHSHSQIFAASFVPPHIIDKLTKAEEYRIRNGNCYYCDLIKKESRGPRFIMADEHALAFTPYASIYAYEAWIMPKKHVDNITVLSREEIASIAFMIKHITAKLKKESIPYNMFLHQSITNKEEHFYIRICPRRDVWAGLEMGSRLIVNPVSPEEAAVFYRKK